MSAGGTKPGLWTPAQRRVLIAFVLLLCGALAVRLYRNRQYISNPAPEELGHHDDLADRLDPNTAEWPALAVLPQLGEKRAKEIVSFRERQRALHPNEPAFRELRDLLRIRGIGVSTLESLRPFLVFPTTTPATKPATRSRNTAPP